MSELLREEFNRWALEGRGAQLEAHHRSFVEQILPEMDLQPKDRILEMGCGEGWASRMLAERATEGLVLGLDVSDEMIRNARAKSLPYENLLFVWSSAAQIPWQEDFFTKVLAVESFYYFPDPGKSLREIYRVLAPGGTLWVLNHLSKENALSLRWLEELKVPVQLRSAEQYSEMFQQCGFERFAYQMIPDRTPVALDSTNQWFSDPEELRRFRELGALLLTARKPQR